MPQPKSAEKPDADDWLSLFNVLLHVEDIVSDADIPPAATPELSEIKGLLWTEHPQSELSAESEPPPQPVPSRLKAGSAFTLDTNRLEKLEAILPGIGELGSSRQERVQNLKAKLSSMRAYAWLTREPGFVSAVKTTEYWAKREMAGYKSDINDFRLASAVAPAFMLLTGEVTSNYPEREEVKIALESAERVAEFLNRYGGLVRKRLIDFGTRQKAEEVVDQLAAVMRTKYKKPRENFDPVVEDEFAYILIASLTHTFGSPSKKILANLLAVIGYTPDDSRLDKLVSGAAARGG
jgi:hypothetical protein